MHHIYPQYVETAKGVVEYRYEITSREIKRITGTKRAIIITAVLLLLYSFISFVGLTNLMDVYPVVLALIGAVIVLIAASGLPSFTPYTAVRRYIATTMKRIPWAGTFPKKRTKKNSNHRYYPIMAPYEPIPRRSAPGLFVGIMFIFTGIVILGIFVYINL